MLYTVNQFCNYVSADLNGLVMHLQKISRVVSDAEVKAWYESFPQVSAVLSTAMKIKPQIGDAHISTSNMLLEYRLPSASAWCDLVLIGKNQQREKQVVIVELKNWMKNNSDLPGMSEGLMIHNGNIIQHPSDQVKGYTEYCRRFHSTVLENHAKVKGCVFFTKPISIEPYIEAPNIELSKEFPIFNSDLNADLADFLTEYIEEPDLQFAEEFVKGYYKQDRNILIQVANNLKDSNASPFVLLDEQRKGFNLIKKILSDKKLELNNKIQSIKKDVIIVQGPPGSGKSALAANLWFDSVINYIASKKEPKNQNILFVTTSSSQTKNWKDTFKKFGGNYVASNLIMSANQFNPGISSNMISELKEYFSEINDKYIVNGALNRAYWKEYVDYINKKNGRLKYFENQHFISIVDEAHALIDPTIQDFKTNKHGGWSQAAGPHAWHIIKASQVSVFFLDSKQSYRDNETTTVKAIESFADELEANVSYVSLEEMQFRCGGAKEYIDWIESLFKNEALDNIHKWKNRISFDFVDYPHQLDEELSKRRIDDQIQIRLLSSYSRKWVTKLEKKPHALSPQSKDFYFEYKFRDTVKVYSKIWNYAPKEDYTLYIKGQPLSEMGKDPLCEVGCPYVVRGFDFDYIGILWLEDLVIRNGVWTVQTDFVEETAINTTKSAAKRNKDNSELLKRVMQGYRILLTRAIKGVVVYVKDKETSEWLRKAVNKSEEKDER